MLTQVGAGEKHLPRVQSQLHSSIQTRRQPPARQWLSASSTNSTCSEPRDLTCVLQAGLVEPGSAFRRMKVVMMPK